MHIWTIENWKKNYYSNHRKGLRFVIDKGVEDDVRNECKKYGSWLRNQYQFPIRVPIYVKSKKRIKASDGEHVVGTFFQPDCKDVEPYIRVAAGDYIDLKNKKGKDIALAEILFSIAHELTHYFQWINDIKLTERGEERQANAYAEFVLDEYYENRDKQ